MKEEVILVSGITWPSSQKHQLGLQVVDTAAQVEIGAGTNTDATLMFNEAGAGLMFNDDVSYCCNG